MELTQCPPGETAPPAHPGARPKGARSEFEAPRDVKLASRNRFARFPASVIILLRLPPDH